MRGKIKVKEWLYETIQREASIYDVWLDVVYDSNDMIDRTDGKVTVYFEEMYGETDKALHVKLGSGAVVGSCRGWNVWLPKSLTKIVEVIE